MQILALWEEGLVKRGSWKLSGLVRCYVTNLEFHTAGSTWELKLFFLFFPLSNLPQRKNGLNFVGTIEASAVQVTQPLNQALGCCMTHP